MAQDTADIINAGANATESVGGILGLFVGGGGGNTTTTATDYTAEEEIETANAKKKNFLLIGGVSVGIILLILALVYMNKTKPATNGSKAKQ